MAESTPVSGQDDADSADYGREDRAGGRDSDHDAAKCFVLTTTNPDPAAWPAKPLATARS